MGGHVGLGVVAVVVVGVVVVGFVTEVTSTDMGTSSSDSSHGGGVGHSSEAAGIEGCFFD